MGLKKLLATAAVAVMAATTLMAAPAQAVNIGYEGCSPGYWKNHEADWQEAKPGKLLSSAFDIKSYPDATFRQALRFKGGPGLDGAYRILMRSATAAWLNAAHEGLGYPLRRNSVSELTGEASLVDQVNKAIASGKRAKMLALYEKLDMYNNLGCDLGGPMDGGDGPY
jgi:hypothetical protein